MAAFDKLQAELDAMPAGEPGAARGVIDHIESSIRRARPDLWFSPDNPRVPIAEATFVREIDVYLKFGTEPEGEANRPETSPDSGASVAESTAACAGPSFWWGACSAISDRQTGACAV